VEADYECQKYSDESISSFIYKDLLFCSTAHNYNIALQLLLLLTGSLSSPFKAILRSLTHFYQSPATYL
jgi:hypothetical protein